MRLIDLTVAGAALPLLALPAVLIALLVRMDSPGPALFRQERVGRNGRLFRIFKFRTMVKGAEALGTSVTTGGDPRITAVGRVLRRTKFDELPQLINVIRGEMSLIGPRPEIPEIVRHYTAEMAEVLNVRPGITSLASLHLRDEQEILSRAADPDRFYLDTLVPLKVDLAMEHARRDSLFFDLAVLAKTLWMVTLGRFWPVREHPRVARFREDAANVSQRKGQCGE